LGEENIITITEISLLVKKKNSGKWEGLHGLPKASNSGCRWLTCVCVCVCPDLWRSVTAPKNWKTGFINSMHFFKDTGERQELT